MDILEAIFARKTTNTAFRPDPVTLEHQHLLITAAGAAPSHFNSQPWRFILIERRETIETIAGISGRSMRRLLEQGLFWERYRPYFRFSEGEMAARRDGILIDHLPAPLKPFIKGALSPQGTRLMTKIGVPRLLAEDNRKLVAGSPLVLAVLLDKREYKPEALSGFYSLFGLGAAVENIWLLVASLGMGIQFISAPMEVPAAWEEIGGLLKVPEELKLMALYRLGYLPEAGTRPSIDWSSRQRKTVAQLACREVWGEAEREAEQRPAPAATSQTRGLP
ncbi:nitroreductase family protein [soil metagenome]